MTQTTGLAPRIAAHTLICAVTVDGRLLSEVLPAVLSSLPPEDRARANRLAIDTLRWMDRADRMLKPFLQKRPPHAVANALRLGTVEIWQHGEAAHGVVNACVEIVGRDRKTATMKGLVNAVLRKVAAERPGAWDRLPAPRLPDWLRRPMIDAWGKAVVPAMEAAHTAGAPIDLTAKTDPAKVAEMTGGQLLPTGSIRLADAGQVSTLPGFEAGDWWVQDAAAAMPVRLLAPRKGERILDLCAAPGGKTLQIASVGADVTAVDISVGRMARVEQNLTRTGLTATTVISDAFDYDINGFDAIILDAPCSATGTIRRHPDLPYAKDGSEFGELIDQQGALIDHALTLLKPGGRLVFCTCSLLPDEGEVQIEEALARNSQLIVDKPDPMAGIDNEWFTPEGGIRLRPDYWPQYGGMDGFYMAVLRMVA